jgi:hypothetical protein
VTAVVPGDHVARSVTAAATALAHLEQSLRAGGFADGAAAYTRMADVLVAQRLFLAADDEQLGEQFGALGSSARRVFELLEPYTAAMRQLATLAPPRIDARTLAAVHDQLARRGRRGASLSVLARTTRLPADQVERAVGQLVADGRVAGRCAGDTTTYRLVPQPDEPRPALIGRRG